MAVTLHFRVFVLAVGVFCSPHICLSLPPVELDLIGDKPVFAFAARIACQAQVKEQVFAQVYYAPTHVKNSRIVLPLLKGA